MKTVIIKTEILADGHIRLDIPCDLQPGPVEVCVVIQPQGRDEPTPGQLVSTFEGCLVGKIADPESVESILDEMKRDWQATVIPG